MATNNNVWKFPLAKTVYNEIQMPVGAKVLHVGMQRSTITLWAAVDTDAQVCTREFMTQGTGQEKNPRIHDAIHLGTVFDGGYVWHVFEVEGG